MKVLDIYKQKGDNLSIDIDYKIKWMSKNLLSIQYIGTGFVDGGAYPNNISYTANYTLREGIKIKLTDFINLDENFVDKFQEGQYVKYDPELDVEKESKNELGRISKDELIKYLNEADNISIDNEMNVFSYFTEDSLGISVSVPHTIGDHVEIEIKYQDIVNNIKPNYEVWDELEFPDLINQYYLRSSKP